MQAPQALNLLRNLFATAVGAAQADKLIAENLPTPPVGRTIVIGAGKAAGVMALALERCWPSPLQGTVVTRTGYGVTCTQIKLIEAAHPLPDQAGLQAARAVYKQVQGLNADDLVIALFSGGGSALLPLPAHGLDLQEKRHISKQLLLSGANISEINCVRRHLSAIKGGHLAVACYPARVHNLLISDVPGDAPNDIASGPCVPDPSSCSDALEIVQRYHIQLSSEALALLRSGAGETIKATDPRIRQVQTSVIATPQLALQAAADAALAAGIQPLILSDRIQGEAREIGKALAAIALQARAYAQPLRPPCVLLSGGETTVSVNGTGRGGPNAECLLACALELNAASGIYALMADTDGIDGAATIAGALIGPDTLQKARALGLNARTSLDNNDAHSFFEHLQQSLVTGPTFTNVNDFRALLIL